MRPHEDSIIHHNSKIAQIHNLDIALKYFADIGDLSFCSICIYREIGNPCKFTKLCMEMELHHKSVIVICDIKFTSCIL